MSFISSKNTRQHTVKDKTKNNNNNGYIYIKHTKTTGIYNINKIKNDRRILKLLYQMNHHQH